MSQEKHHHEHHHAITKALHDRRHGKDSEIAEKEAHQKQFKAQVELMQEQFVEDLGGDMTELQFEIDHSYTLPEITDLELQEGHNHTVLPPTIGHPSHATRTLVKRVLLLYNPASGGKQGAKIALKAVELFNDRGVETIAKRLERRGHAEEILKTADLGPFDVIGVLGGDGTFHEAVNGMMKRNPDLKKIPLAFIAGGTGNSFSLELQGGIQVERSIKHIIRGLSCPIDIGLISFPKPDGQEEIIYSFNSIHWGLASKVNVTAERLRWMGKAVRYTTATMLELVKGVQTRAKVTLELENKEVLTYDENFCLVIVNNIMTAAKGMKMAPNALLNDGLFDILLIRSNKTVDLMKVFKDVYSGTHVNSADVEYRQVRAFSIVPYEKDDHNTLATESDPTLAEELVDIDGELKGGTPFFCRVIPRAIRVII